jgi:hypothetical protein
MDEVGPEYGISVGRSQLVFAGYPLTQMNIFCFSFWPIVNKMAPKFESGEVPPIAQNRPSTYEAALIPSRPIIVLDECEDTAKSQSFRFSLDDGEEVELVNRLGVLPLLIRAKRTLEWSLGTV